MSDDLSPLDGRYKESVESLREFFSEDALVKARLEVEVRYFLALSREKAIKELPSVSAKQQNQLLAFVENLSDKDTAKVKDIEKTTKHDVKAVEYFLQQIFKKIGMTDHVPFIHFALTSEDVNNLSYGILIHRALKKSTVPSLRELVRYIAKMASTYKKAELLSLTHGQPATPTTMGKELLVFVARLERQLTQLQTFKMQGKLGGAVGNFSAHKVAYPEINWERFRTQFLKRLGLDPMQYTTQINPHDDIAELSHILFRINTILLDFSRDVWMYVSRGVFKQRVVAGEVGSSTMPHKINPIDFENAEGNLGLSNALFAHFAEKLPVSRLQRDLSDSTVQRNIGVAFGYHLLAVKSLLRGLGKLTLDQKTLKQELESHPEVYGEAIQTILRKHGVQNAYEKLKELTRGEHITKADLHAFVESLPIPASERIRLIELIG